MSSQMCCDIKSPLLFHCDVNENCLSLVIVWNCERKDWEIVYILLVRKYSLWDLMYYEEVMQWDPSSYVNCKSFGRNIS